MISLVIFAAILWAVCQADDDYYYRPSNVTRSTLAGIQAYRSALTLDWLAAEDMRQRELAAAFETEMPLPTRLISSDCIAYPRPASGKIARLMLELLKNLEGDESPVVSDMIGELVRSKLLVETSMLDAEPDLDALVKTPGVMMGEPHTTFPRVLAMTWMTVTDPVTTKKFGWCPLQKVNQYLGVSRPVNIAKHMRDLEPVIARARFIMEEFIQNVTPLNMYEKKTPPTVTKRMQPHGSRTRSTYPQRTHNLRTAQVLFALSGTTSAGETPIIYSEEPRNMLPIESHNSISEEPRNIFSKEPRYSSSEKQQVATEDSHMYSDEPRIFSEESQLSPFHQVGILDADNDRIVLLTSSSSVSTLIISLCTIVLPIILVIRPF